MANALNGLLTERELRFEHDESKGWQCRVASETIALVANARLVKFLGFRRTDCDGTVRVEFRKAKPGCERHLVRKRRYIESRPSSSMLISTSPGGTQEKGRATIISLETIHENVCVEDEFDDKELLWPLQINLKAFAPRMLVVNGDMVDQQTAHCSGVFNRNLTIVPLGECTGAYYGEYSPKTVNFLPMTRNRHEALRFRLYDEFFVPLYVKSNSWFILDLQVT